MGYANYYILTALGNADFITNYMNDEGCAPIIAIVGKPSMTDLEATDGEILDVHLQV